MKLKYVNEIKANISLEASRKTNDLFNGLYRSIYKGRSLDFDDLRDYVIGDESKDIDWKSSIRHGSLLVRRYVALKRQNILFIIDNGLKMDASSSSFEKKSDIVLYTFGTFAYFANKNENDIATLYNSNGIIKEIPFRTGLTNLEMSLSYLEKVKNEGDNIPLDKYLDFALRHYKKKMILVIISDLEGINNISEDMIKKVSINNDILFININDAYFYGNKAFDVSKNEDVPKYITQNKKLFNIEVEERNKIFNDKNAIFKKYRITNTTIENKKEISFKIVDLLKRHNDAIR